MFSFDLIAANNGWAMAFAGALIVMSGLTVLSIVISQLHKLVTFLEKKEKPKTEAVASAMLPPPVSERFDPSDVDKTARLYRPIAMALGDTFELKALYKAATRDDMPHPHLSIRTLREAGIIVPAGQGLFSWS